MTLQIRVYLKELEYFLLLHKIQNCFADNLKNLALFLLNKITFTISVCCLPKL